VESDAEHAGYRLIGWHSGRSGISIDTQRVGMKSHGSTFEKTRDADDKLFYNGACFLMHRLGSDDSKRKIPVTADGVFDWVLTIVVHRRHAHRLRPTLR
jgi:hypothetical protein